MSTPFATLAAAIAAIAIAAPCRADQPAGDDPGDKLKTHQQGSVKLADEQDELSADVQQLILEQTVEKIIELLEEVEGSMDDATDRLEDQDTGGETIAAQTDVIEKIYEAAKQRQQQGQSGSSPSGAMLDMMEYMMGKKGDGDPSKGDKPADSGGGGMTGESDAANEATAGDPAGTKEKRTVKKASGNAGREIPAEFRDALDAFNRGSQKLTK